MFYPIIHKPLIENRGCDANLSRRQGNKQALAAGVRTTLRLLFLVVGKFALLPRFQRSAMLRADIVSTLGAAIRLLNQRWPLPFLYLKYYTALRLNG